MLRIVIGLCTLGLLAEGSAFAQEDFVGVRALGMGEAMRASATGAEAALLNPAAMSLVKQYVIEAQYGLRVEDLGHHTSVAIVDSITTRVGASLYYNFAYSSPKFGFVWPGGFVKDGAATRIVHVAGLALSVPIGEKVILGATTKYVYSTFTAPLPMGSMPTAVSFGGVNGVTWDASMLLRLGKFNLTTIGYNLWDHGSRETPLGLGMAVAVIPVPELTLNFDSVVNFTGYQSLRYDKDNNPVYDTRITARIGAGLEYTIKQKVPIRLGYTYDSGRPASFVSVGLGYVSNLFGIDVGYRSQVQGGRENFIMTGLRIFVP